VMTSRLIRLIQKMDDATPTNPSGGDWLCQK
jgi:hypothetical protein